MKTSTIINYKKYKNSGTDLTNKKLPSILKSAFFMKHPIHRCIELKIIILTIIVISLRLYIIF